MPQSRGIALMMTARSGQSGQTVAPAPGPGAVPRGEALSAGATSIRSTASPPAQSRGITLMMTARSGQSGQSAAHSPGPGAVPRGEGATSIRSTVSPPAAAVVGPRAAARLFVGNALRRLERPCTPPVQPDAKVETPLLDQMYRPRPIARPVVVAAPGVVPQPYVSNARTFYMRLDPSPPPPVRPAVLMASTAAGGVVRPRAPGTQYWGTVGAKRRRLTVFDVTHVEAEAEDDEHVRPIDPDQKQAVDTDAEVGAGTVQPLPSVGVRQAIARAATEELYRAPSVCAICDVFIHISAEHLTVQLEPDTLSATMRALLSGRSLEPPLPAALRTQYRIHDKVRAAAAGGTHLLLRPYACAAVGRRAFVTARCV